MIDLFGAPAPLTNSQPTSVQLLDTTLRDGEQAPGIALSPEEKVEIARTLDETGMSVIEAGSACTGEGERAAMRRVVEQDLDATVTSFTRGIESDIDHALDVGVDGVHLVVPASDRHVQQKVDSTRESTIENTRSLVAYAKEEGLWVEVIGEDGSRADLEFLEDLMAASLDAGADRVCFADTVGHAGPERCFEAVSRLADLGPVSAHTHDDLGLGLTNALACVAAGADLVHGTVNGIGERAGNVALEEVAISLHHVYDVDTVELDQLYSLAELVSDATGVPLPPNKAVVGENAFTHESGIHTDGTLKDEAMYEPYPPETVGRERRLVVGKHAGRAGVRAALAERGVDLSEDELSEVVERVKELGERDKRVTDADLLAIAEDASGVDRERRVTLAELTAVSGDRTPTASVTLVVDGEERTASGVGDGPVDAALNAVGDALEDAVFRLDSYHVDAVTGGTDAMVTVEVGLSRGDKSVTVSASDADITRASVQAMVDGLDRLYAMTPDQPVSLDD
ncbi:MAG: 2-isopropylmalate synthase [Halobacteriales archaeon]